MIYSIYFASIIFLSCHSQQVDKGFGDNQQQPLTALQNNKVQTDTTKRPFQVVFKNAHEIRMGSPYNTCDIELVGTDKIQLPKANWQDKFAWSSDSKILVLVKWNIDNNNPVFKLIFIDTETGAIQESIKILGAVNSLRVTGKTVRYNKFYYDKVKSREKLCCEVEEDYTFR